MEGFENKENGSGKVRNEIFSKAVRAGKRTYFFDVKATRRNDYYLTITESKKKFNQDGSFFYEKHKVFLYKEDFEKFTEGLEEVVSFIKENQPELTPREDMENDDPNKVVEKFTDVSFDDLDEDE
ncbi:MAG: DUF3276 family protein [Salinivirgaceae bacterium]